MVYEWIILFVSVHCAINCIDFRLIFIYLFIFAAYVRIAGGQTNYIYGFHEVLHFRFVIWPGKKSSKLRNNISMPQNDKQTKNVTMNLQKNYLQIQLILADQHNRYRKPHHVHVKSICKSWTEYTLRSHAHQGHHYSSLWFSFHCL